VTCPVLPVSVSTDGVPIPGRWVLLIDPTPGVWRGIALWHVLKVWASSSWGPTAGDTP
jgi:hypothetical protein